jgi:glycolate oxidase
MTTLSIEKLKGIVGEVNVRDDEADRYVYGSDASVHAAMPQVVVRPENTEFKSYCNTPVGRRSP